MANLAGEACAVRRRRGSRVDRWVRLLSCRWAQFEIPDLPKLTVETLDIVRFEYLDEHADAFFKSRCALRGIDAHPIQNPRMAAADADHDPPFREQIGNSNLTGKNRRSSDLQRRANNSGKKANSPRAL